MVRRDVEQNGDVGAEVVHVVQLETAQLDDVVCVRIFGDLQGEAVADVACQPGIVSGILEDVIDEARRRRLSVTSRDTDHLRVRVTAGKLYLADDVRALCHELLDHRSFLGDARTLDDLVGIEDFLFRVMLLFPFDAVVVEQFLVLVLDGRHIRHEDVEALFFSQYGGTGSALSGTQYYDSFHISFPFLTLVLPAFRSPGGCPRRRYSCSRPSGITFPAVGESHSQCTPTIFHRSCPNGRFILSSM